MRRRLAILVLAVVVVAAPDAPARADGAGSTPVTRPAGVLRVCSDPNNLPFSSRREDGFENRIARLLADELGWRVEYTWWAQRRGFIRSTLRAGQCDVILGIASGHEMALTTRPYYRSTYVFVTRADRGPIIRSLGDPRLRRLRIGVHVIGDDGANAPPAHALSLRGIVDNVIGYSVYGDYTADSPPADLLRAVQRGDIDVAIAWGPLAGAFARDARPALRVTAMAAASDRGLAMQFDISMGVRHGDDELARLLERAVARRRREIDAILAAYGVPRVHASRTARREAP